MLCDRRGDTRLPATAALGLVLVRAEIASPQFTQHGIQLFDVLQSDGNGRLYLRKLSRLRRGSTGNAGGPGDTVQITATYTWYPFVITRFVPTMFPGGKYTFSVTSTFVNEPFAPPS